jgi:hypothetical protein
MVRKFIAGRQVLDSRPHPTKPGRMQVKFRCRPRLVDGETRMSVWEEMAATDYRRQLYLTRPPARTQIESRMTDPDVES